MAKAKVPQAGGYAYGAYNPYTHAPAEGQDYETAAGTPLYLPPGAQIVQAGSNGALGNFAVIKADGKFFWFGHLNTVIQGATPGQQFATTGSPETAGGYGHGAHLWFAVSRTQDLGTNLDPRPYIVTPGLWSPSGAGATVHVGQTSQTAQAASQGSAVPPSMANPNDPLQAFFAAVNGSTGANLPIPQADIWGSEGPPTDQAPTETTSPETPETPPPAQEGQG